MPKKTIFRPYITVNNKRIYAKWYGIRAFPIEVDIEEASDAKCGKPKK